MRYRLSLCLLLLLLVAPALAGPSELRQDFQLEEGGQQHFFTWTGPGQAHLLNRPDGRLVVAFPADNVGVALWYGDGVDLRVQSPPRMVPQAHGQALEAMLHSTRPRVVISDVVLDSIRTIRDRQTLGPRGAEAVRADREAFARLYPVPEAWSREVAECTGEALVFRRVNLDGGEFRAWLALPRGVVARPLGRGWEIVAPGPFDLRLVAAIPEERYTPFAVSELFSREALALRTRLLQENDPRAARVQASMQGLLFLADREKLMAGSWRFLTYFGRDTLLSLMLLEPALTPQARALGLRSVLERQSPDGQVAHEEDLGPWAERTRVAEAVAGRGQALPRPGERLSPQAVKALYAPLYDYKMVDDDFMLAPALARLPEAELQALMKDPSARKRVFQNQAFVLQQARPLAQAGGADAWRHGVALRPGFSVGDWRDSNEGLGWGRYAGNVNRDLVPVALRAIARLHALLPEDLRRDAPEAAAQAGDLARAWDAAGERYLVRLSEAEVRARLRAFLDRAPLTPEEKRFYLARPVGASTLQAFLEGAHALPDGLTFPALSLSESGRPVAVMNTDFGFRLFLGEPGAQEVEASLELLENEYPLGLMTGVGPVVANAAYSQDERHWRELGRGAYHGAVIWSWQSAMLRQGLARQRERFADRQALAERLDRVLERLARAEAEAGDLAGSELWTFEVRGGAWKAVPFGVGTSSSSDESNPVQLWSTVYPAVLMREEAARRVPAAR